MKCKRLGKSFHKKVFFFHHQKGHKLSLNRSSQLARHEIDLETTLWRSGHHAALHLPAVRSRFVLSRKGCSSDTWCNSQHNHPYIIYLPIPYVCMLCRSQRWGECRALLFGPLNCFWDKILRNFESPED